MMFKENSSRRVFHWTAIKFMLAAVVFTAVLCVCGCAQIADEPLAVGLIETEPPETEPPETEPPVTEPPETEPPETEPPETEPPETEPPVTEPPVTEPPETEPPETEPPVTEPPVTEPPVTEPPVTEPPETEPPVTEPPVTEPPETEPPETEPPETEPPVTVGDNAAAAKTADPTIPSAKAETTAEAAKKYTPLILSNEAAIIAGASVEGIKTPSAPGTGVKTNDDVSIDYSNAADGYCMLRYTGKSDARKIVRVLPPSGVTYDYLLTDLSGWNVYPFSEGSGTYKITLYEQRAAGKYTPLLSAEIAAVLKDDFTAFLYPNCFVNFSGASSCAKLAKYICDGKTQLEKVNAVFDYVVDNLGYDYAKASSVAGGYCPDLESIVKTKTGICFDYASLMTAMLRSVGLPAKLIFGYADTVYHAWISVYTAESGWIDGIIHFDGSKWELMDPTYASTSERSESVMKRVENSSNYSQVYVY